MADECCLKMPDFHVTFRDLLHAVNLRHGTNGFTSLPKEGVLKNPTTSAGFEPANLRTKCQHATTEAACITQFINKLFVAVTSIESIVYVSPAHAFEKARGVSVAPRQSKLLRFVFVILSEWMVLSRPHENAVDLRSAGTAPHY